MVMFMKKFNNVFEDFELKKSGRFKKWLTLGIVAFSSVFSQPAFSQVNNKPVIELSAFDTKISSERMYNELLDVVVSKNLNRALEKIDFYLNNSNGLEAEFKELLENYSFIISEFKNEGMDFFFTNKGFELLILYRDDSIFINLLFLANLNNPDYLRNYVIDKIFNHYGSIEIILTDPQEKRVVNKEEFHILMNNRSKTSTGIERLIIIPISPLVYSTGDENLIIIQKLRVKLFNMS